jgi:hypothetical protein
MFYPPLNSSSSLGGILLLPLLIYSAIAHEVKVSENVAATFHLEPDHSPKAGQSSQAWFVLTRTGGKIIPLEQCNCKLTVRSEPSLQGSKPLLNPPLKAISAEQYQGIPGADIVFPKPGAYRLTLMGTPKTNAPKTNANFQPFELTYTVTVGAGTTLDTDRSPQAATRETELPRNVTQKQSQSVPQWQIPVAVGIVLGGVGAIAVWAGRSKR